MNVIVPLFYNRWGQLMGRSNQGMRFLPLSQSTVKGLDRNGLKEELGERRLHELDQDIIHSSNKRNVY